MILQFITTFPEGTGLGNQPTHFVPKIWRGIMSCVKINAQAYIDKGNELSNEDADLVLAVRPKVHTFRKDSDNEIHPSTPLKMVVEREAHEIYQFVPTIPCISTQKAEIYPDRKVNPVIIDGRALKPTDIIRLAHNDGFNDTAEFFAYFNQPWKGKLIHWTDLKY